MQEKYNALLHQLKNYKDVIEFNSHAHAKEFEELGSILDHIQKNQKKMIEKIYRLEL